MKSCQRLCQLLFEFSRFVHIIAVMKRYSPVDMNNCKFMSRSEVRGFDAWAINDLGVPGVVLMENAGKGCAEIIVQRLADENHAKVCIFCGCGNNGGDGYVIARHLYNAGIDVTVLICGDRARIKGDALINLEIIDRMKIDIRQMDPGDVDLAELTAGCSLIVDAIFGTGLSGELREDYKMLVEGINSSKADVVAVDIPSGLDCDTGKPLGAAVKAGITVTFVAVKKGFARETAVEYTGDIYVVSIGVEPDNNIY